MTLGEYIQKKFQSFGITLSEADLLDVSLNSGIANDEAVTSANIPTVSVGMAKFIPQLLLRATSISESGFSMSWNIEGIKQYYAYLCRTYGLKDEINTNKPTVNFLQ